MRAACTGRYQIDKTFTHGCAFFGERHAPLRALTFGKTFACTIGKTFLFKQRYYGLASQGLHQIIAQTTFVLPRLGFFGFLIQQGDGHTWHQHRFAAQQMG